MELKIKIQYIDARKFTPPRNTLCDDHQTLNVNFGWMDISKSMTYFLAGFSFIILCYRELFQAITCY
jgi:hypothetical protein